MSFQASDTSKPVTTAVWLSAHKILGNLYYILLFDTEELLQVPWYKQVRSLDLRFNKPFVWFGCMVKVENHWSKKAPYTVVGDFRGVSPVCWGRATGDFLDEVSWETSGRQRAGEKGFPSRENNCTKAPTRKGLVSY